MAGRYLPPGLVRQHQSLFQSSPGLMAGRYSVLNQTRQRNAVFQSSPGLMAGRYVRGLLCRSCNRGFNPRPA